MKNIIVTGSIAYDHIMEYDGVFEDSLLHDHLKHISVSFIAKSHDFYFGGCAPNIAYTLDILGDRAYIFGVAGSDFDRYKNELERKGWETKYIDIDNNHPTAAAYILTDKTNNQISIFSSGAMLNTDLCMRFKDIDLETIEYAIISPDSPERMISFAKECVKNGVKFIFDPGQVITAFLPDELLYFIENCEGILTNHYETDVMSKKLDLTVGKIAAKAGFFVKTVGKDGCMIYKDGEFAHLPAIDDLDVVDVTGGGDAFRGGFLHGLLNGSDIKKSCEMGLTASSFAVEMPGAQNHSFTLNEFNKRLSICYGE